MHPTALRLRPLQHQDAKTLAGWGQDELFCRHAGWTVTSSAALDDFWVRHIEEPPDGLVRLAAEDADRELVGYVDLHGSNPGERELGFVIGPSRHWGSGLGRRAAEAALTYGFKELTLECVWAEALAANIASVKILRSVGMQETGEGGPGVFLGKDSYYLQFRTTRDNGTARLER